MGDSSDSFCAWTTEDDEYDSYTTSSYPEATSSSHLNSFKLNSDYPAWSTFLSPYESSRLHILPTDHSSISTGPPAYLNPFNNQPSNTPQEDIEIFIKSMQHQKGQHEKTQPRIEKPLTGEVKQKQNQKKECKEKQMNLSIDSTTSYNDSTKSIYLQNPKQSFVNKTSNRRANKNALSENFFNEYQSQQDMHISLNESSNSPPNPSIFSSSNVQINQEFSKNQSLGDLSSAIKLLKTYSTSSPSSSDQSDKSFQINSTQQSTKTIIVEKVDNFPIVSSSSQNPLFETSSSIFPFESQIYQNHNTYQSKSSLNSNLSIPQLQALNNTTEAIGESFTYTKNHQRIESSTSTCSTSASSALSESSSPSSSSTSPTSSLSALAMSNSINNTDSMSVTQSTGKHNNNNNHIMHNVNKKNTMSISQMLLNSFSSNTVQNPIIFPYHNTTTATPRTSSRTSPQLNSFSSLNSSKKQNPIHIFVDYSNISIGLKTMYSRYSSEKAPKLDLKLFLDWVKMNRNIDTAWVIGSQKVSSSHYHYNYHYHRHYFRKSNKNKNKKTMFNEVGMVEPEWVKDGEDWGARVLVLNR